MSDMSLVMPIRRTNLKLALLLAVAGALATVLLFPYLQVLMPRKLAAQPMPLGMTVALKATETGVLCGLLGWLGLHLGGRYGLDAPWLRAWIEQRPRAPARQSNWGLAVALGLLSAVSVVVISRLSAPAVAMHEATAVNWAWRGALASFYGGGVEETLCRLLPVSLFVWLLAWTHRRIARPWMFAMAIVLAALLFGAGHLPAAFAAGIAHTPLQIGRIVLSNALVGLATGMLFWKYGLEHAMLGHFCADLVLHVGAPLIGML